MTSKIYNIGGTRVRFRKLHLCHECSADTTEHAIFENGWEFCSLACHNKYKDEQCPTCQERGTFCEKCIAEMDKLDEEYGWMDDFDELS